MHYPLLTIDLQKLEQNTRSVVDLTAKHSITVAGVIKGCSGLPRVAEAMLAGGCREIASSRLWQLEQCRKEGITEPLMMIRLPMLSEIDRLIATVDISLNSERLTLDAIETACIRQNCTHQVILMVDVGDLREGIMDIDDLVTLAQYVESKLRHVHLLGLGTNTACYGSVRPTQKNTQMLCDAVDRVEASIGRSLELISAGASPSLPLLLKGEMPPRVNHLRIGSAILTPAELEAYWAFDLPGIYPHPFTLQAQIIEVSAKPTYPIGELFIDAFGNRPVYHNHGVRRRAILAVGNADLGDSHKLIPKNPNVQILGASSDHLLVDLADCSHTYRVGDLLEFGMLYQPLLFLSTNRSVQKLYLEDRKPCIRGV